MLKQVVNIKLPERIKVFLVDDWDAVTRQKKVKSSSSMYLLYIYFYTSSFILYFIFYIYVVG